MSEPILTTAPIPAPILKEIVRGGLTQEVIIDVDNSTLGAQGLLVYLTNLGLDARFQFASEEGLFALLTAYLKSPMLHDFPQLAKATLDMLLQIKGHPDPQAVNYHSLIIDPDLRGVLTRWLSLVESLSLYMMTWMETLEDKQAYLDQLPHDGSTDLCGINFVKLIGYDDFPLVIEDPDPTRLVYHSHFYDRQVFRGSTLANYWAVANNPLFVISQAMDQGTFDEDKFNACLQADLADLENDYVPTV